MDGDGHHLARRPIKTVRRETVHQDTASRQLLNRRLGVVRRVGPVAVRRQREGPVMVAPLCPRLRREVRFTSILIRDSQRMTNHKIVPSQIGVFSNRPYRNTTNRCQIVHIANIYRHRCRAVMCRITIGNLNRQRIRTKRLIIQRLIRCHGDHAG